MPMTDTLGELYEKFALSEGIENPKRMTECGRAKEAHQIVR